MKTTYKLAALSILLAAFLFCALQKLSLPGYQSDEGFYTVPALNLIQNTSLDEHVDYRLIVFGRRLPLMNGSYIGSTQVYLLVPFLQAFGKNYLSSRLMPIFLAMISIGLVWLLCEYLFNWRVALMAGTLTGLNASYILWSRIGLLGEGPLLVTLGLLTMIFLARWYREGKQLFLFAAAFTAGFGLYTKINFLFILAGLTVSAAVFQKALAAKLTKKQAFVSVLFFLLGLSPLIVFNIDRGFETLKVVFWAASTGMSPYGNENNWNFTANFVLRVKQLISMLGGGAYYTAGQKTPQPLIFLVFVFSWIFTAVKLTLRKNERQRAPAAIILICAAAVFAGSCFTTSGFFNHHLFIIYPFAFITIALFFDHWARYPKMAGIVIAPVLAVYLAMNAHTLYAKYRYMQESGERAEWSGAVYDLDRYLEESNIQKPLTMDGRVKYNLQVLSGGRIDPVIINYENGDFAQNCNKSLSEKGNHYIFLSPRCYTFRGKISPYKTFLDCVKKNNKELRLERTFPDKQGETVYTIFSAEDKRR